MRTALGAQVLQAFPGRGVHMDFKDIERQRLARLEREAAEAQQREATRVEEEARRRHALQRLDAFAAEKVAAMLRAFPGQAERLGLPERQLADRDSARVEPCRWTKKVPGLPRQTDWFDLQVPVQLFPAFPLLGITWDEEDSDSETGFYWSVRGFHLHVDHAGSVWDLPGSDSEDLTAYGHRFRQFGWATSVTARTLVDTVYLRGRGLPNPLEVVLCLDEVSNLIASAIETVLVEDKPLVLHGFNHENPAAWQRRAWTPPKSSTGGPGEPPRV